MVQIHSPPQIQQLHAAFFVAAFGFGCESCETLVGRTKPRPIFSHHLRRYFTSSLSNPSAPVLLSQFQPSTVVEGVTIDGNLALLAATDGGFVIADTTA